MRVTSKSMLVAILAMGMIPIVGVAQLKKVDAPQGVVSQDQQINKYIPVDKAMVPLAVKDAVMTDLDGMAIENAFVAKNNTYKLILTSLLDKSKKRTVWIDDTGKWLEKID